MAIARATPTGLVQRGGLSRAAPTGIFQAPAATPVTTLTPDTAELVITGYAPLLATTILPDAASLTVTGHAPALINGLVLKPAPANGAVFFTFPGS